MKRYLRNYSGLVTLLLTIMGYGLVIGTLYGNWLKAIYPNITLETVNLLSHLIAFNNLVAVLALVSGWLFVRSGYTRYHRNIMIAGFSLILVFLVLYLIKTGGGGRKEFLILEGQLLSSYASTIKAGYYTMLAIHILMSIASVPLVIYTLILGLSRPIAKVKTSAHTTVGPWAAGCWIVSLVLGLVCYVMLNHIYAYEFVSAQAV